MPGAKKLESSGVKLARDLPDPAAFAQPVKVATAHGDGDDD